METQITLIVREALSSWRPVSCNLYLVSVASYAGPFPTLMLKSWEWDVTICVALTTLVIWPNPLPTYCDIHVGHIINPWHMHEGYCSCSVCLSVCMSSCYIPRF